MCCDARRRGEGVFASRILWGWGVGERWGCGGLSFWRWLMVGLWVTGEMWMWMEVYKCVVGLGHLVAALA